MALTSRKTQLPSTRSFLPAAQSSLYGEHPPPRGLTSLPQALACPSRGCGTCIMHTPPNSFLDANLSTMGKGQSGLSHHCRNLCTRHLSCLSVPQDMLHIYTLPRGGSGRLVLGTSRTENQDAGACCPPPAAPLPGKPRISHLRWARQSRSWSQRVNQACGEVAEALLSHPQRGGHVLRGWPPSCCRARRGLAGRLPVHPEAIDAGVLGVAPVSQDPQLHHLVHGHCRVLGRERRHQACQSPQT